MTKKILMLVVLVTGCGQSPQKSGKHWQAPEFQFLREQNGVVSEVRDKEINLDDIIRFESSNTFSILSEATCGDERFERLFPLATDMRVHEVLPPNVLKEIGGANRECSFLFTLDSENGKKKYSVSSRIVSLAANDLRINLNMSDSLARAWRQNLTLFNVEITNPYPVGVKLGVATDVGVFNFEMLQFNEKEVCYFYQKYPTAPKPIIVTVLNSDITPYNLNGNTIVEIPAQKKLLIGYSVNIDLPKGDPGSMVHPQYSYGQAAGLDYWFSKGFSNIAFLFDQTQSGVVPTKTFGINYSGLNPIGFKRRPYFMQFADKAYLHLNLEMALRARSGEWNGSGPMQ